LDATAAPHAVEVVLSQTTVLRRSLSNLLTANGHEVPVFVVVRDGSLSVSHATDDLVVDLFLRGWERAYDPSWRMGVLGAATAPAEGDALAGTHTIDQFDVRDAASGGAQHGASSVLEFAVTINAQQFSLDDIPYSYFPPPMLSSVMPESGGSAGGTVVTLHGSHFSALGTHKLCSFAIGGRLALALNGEEWSGQADVVDATRDSDSLLRCLAPRAAFHDDLPNATSVFPVVSPIPVPPNASASGNGTVGRRLSGFDEGSGSLEDGSGSGEHGSGTKEYGSGSGEDGSGSGDAFFENENVTVPAINRVAHVEVALNGRQFSSPAQPFTYFGTPVVSSLSPSCGPALGGTLVDVFGHHLEHGSAYRCRFGHTRVNASYTAQSASLRCVAPAASPIGSAPLEVSLNNQDFTTDGATFATYRAPAVTRLVPRSGIVGGGTRVLVEHGSGPGCDHRCAFGNASEFLVNGTADADDLSTLCSSPPLSLIRTEASERGASHVVEVSLNGQQFTNLAAWQFDYFAPRVSMLSPAFGPTGNSTVVVVHGSHFSARAERYICAFGSGLVINATRHNDSAIVCTTPVAVPDENGTLPSARVVPLEISLNGRDYTVDAQHFAFEPEPTISFISPSLGPTLGGTVIALQGHSFNLTAAQGHIQCRFDVGSHTRYVDVLPVGAATPPVFWNLTQPLPAPSQPPPLAPPMLVMNGTNGTNGTSAVGISGGGATASALLNASTLSNATMRNAANATNTTNVAMLVNGTNATNATAPMAVNASLILSPGTPPPLTPPPSFPPMLPPLVPPATPPPPIQPPLYVGHGIYQGPGEQLNISTLLVCVAPDLFDLGAFTATQANFDSLPSGSRLRGGARIADGRLELSSRVPGPVRHRL
jgi:hypothetical protein